MLVTSVFANEAAEQVASAPAASWTDWVYNNLVFILGSIMIFGAVLGIVRLNNQLMELQKMKLLEEHGIDTMEKLNLTAGESFWDRLSRNWTKAVPIEKEEDVMLDHEYDGIRELDNILPPWWVSMFNISIVFGVLYFGYFHFTDYGYSSHQEWEWEVDAAKEEVKRYLATQTDMVDENTVTLLTDESDLAKGKKIYVDNCKVCHGEFGEGGVGPNFADKYWIHGGDIKDVFRTVKYGVPEKGMISWKAQLKAGDMQKVSSYLLTLQGQAIPDGVTAKEPQGDLYEPTTEEEAAPEAGE